jgi:hypothetical protein
MRDPFAGLAAPALSAAGAARRAQMRGALIGAVVRRRRARRAARIAALLIAALAVGFWVGSRSLPSMPSPRVVVEIVRTRPDVLARLSVPPRRLDPALLLDDGGLQRWLARAGLPSGYVRSGDRLLLAPEVQTAASE